MACVRRTVSLLITCGALFVATWVLSLSATVRAGAPISDPNTLLLLNFDGVLTGADGEIPTTSTGVTFETTPSGEGVLIDDPNDVLRYAATGNFDPAQGTIEFCVKPTWSDGNSDDNDFVGIGSNSRIEKDVNDNLTFFLNTADSEAFQVHDLSDWQAGEWHHIAVTWVIPGTMQTYIDAALEISHSAAAQDLMTAPIPEISIGSRDGAFQADAVIDQFRISNVVRTPSEVLNSAIACSDLTDLELETSHTDLLVTWRITPTIILTGPDGSVTVPISDPNVVWTTSDASVAEFDPVQEQIIAKGPGTATVGASFSALSGTVDLIVAAPARPPEVHSIDPFLATPAPDALYAMPVIILRYLPSADGVNLDVTKSPDFGFLNPISLSELEQTLDDFDKRVKFTLEEGSRFRGYKDANSTPSLGYRVVMSVSVYEIPPPGALVDTPEFCGQGFHIDFHQIFDRLGISALIEAQGVREVWFWNSSFGCETPSVLADPNMFDLADQRRLDESNMASPITGDISNGFLVPDDLPILGHTYVVYGYNFRRTQAEAVHNHGHQLEALFDYANVEQEGNTDLFWGDFGGFDGGTPAGLYLQGRCGSTHFPPNAVVGFDYLNPTAVMSDCEDWRPDGTGAKTLINADTWGDLEYAWPDPDPGTIPQRVESQFYIYWMQNMPGLGNNIPHGSNFMTNWWRLVADWDVSVGTSCSLLSGPVTCPAPLCGNGLLEGGEQCDDENLLDGDGCSSSCLIQGLIEEGCLATPLVGCLSPGGSGKSQLQLKDQGADGPGPKDKIQWKWLKGPGLSQADFGDPLDPNGPDFKLCIYAGATPSLIVEMQVPAGGTCGTKACWKPISTKGYKYGDKGLASDGVKKLLLKGDVAGKSKILIQGKDGNLPLPPLPLDPNGPVIAQLSSSDPNVPCYEETFQQSNVTKNEAKQFKAKTP